MKERPILFSAPMVRAILDGRKTQTRRIIKLPHQNPLGQWEPTTWGGKGARDKHGNEHPEQAAIWHTRTGECFTHGALPGDRLWVRETFNRTNPGGENGIYFYRATDTDQYRDAVWKPSIFMPRAASRITLEITAVRVERLQYISEADAWAEGVAMSGVCYGKKILPSTATGIERYAALWDSLNGAGAWDKNPLVWVIEFKRVTA